MSVTFFEPAIERVLLSPIGMVGLFVERKTTKIRDEVAASAADYFGSAPILAGGIAGDVTSQMDGSTGVISINPSGTGRKWSRLIAMAQDGTWRNRPSTIIEQNRF